jgi:hypothetical protein
MKFLDKLLKNPPDSDTAEMAKILCSLIGCNDKEKAEVLTQTGKLMAKGQGKGGFKIFG